MNLKLNRWLVQTHRWIGIVLCLFFSMWFLSGMVLMYVPFPSLGQQQRLQQAPDIDPATLRISPGQAIAAAKTSELEQLRIIKRDDKTVYVLHPLNESVIAVDADNGTLASVNAATATRIAQQFTNSEVKQLDTDIKYDQWVVSNDFDPYRPFYRARMDDRAGTVIYISAVSGEVVQRTRRTERGWNYVGAVVHWIYPTILRQSWVAWDQVVWWLSLVGVVGVVLGFWLGIVRMQAAKRIKGRGLSPYRGWLRWHHIMGLFAGFFVLTWIVSGWLSMDHGRIFSTPYPTAALKQNFRGTTLEQATAPLTIDIFNGLEPFREAEFTVVNKSIILVARQADGQRIHFPGDSNLSSLGEIPQELVLSAAQNAWPDMNIDAIERPGLSDVYGQLRAGSLPPTAIRIKYDDPAKTWVHVDAASGLILTVVDRSRRQYRWFFNALHSLDIPGLANHRPWWDILMLILLISGFVFSLTAAVIGIKRLRTMAR